VVVQHFFLLFEHGRLLRVFRELVQLGLRLHGVLLLFLEQ